MPQIKVPESISLKAAFAGEDSSVRLLRDSQRPASQGSRFPLSEARHCVQERGQFTPLLSFPIPAVGHREAQPVPHNPPTTDCALNTGLCLSARSEGLGESFPQHLLRHQTLDRRLSPRQAAVQTAVCKHRDLQLTGSNETHLLQNQKADT